ncbi:hypothetical protein B0H66DRAFT_604240 [Apodospora peruviana]|uniref:Nephrocystin 3-like N-terminal domain-containing protein n=1 Tax=Apodospora peruviana TaxID=516989 RepID=A0AAE0M2W0_9PEZI|nr:hypothetical protein B0H66DRAFT_604240 [Apodospora peruviana]
MGSDALPFETWSWYRNTDNFWPLWLAHDEHMESCRIFTFSYNSNFKGDAHGLDVLDFAKDLLLQMLNYPDALGKNRPILFVDKRFASVKSSVVGMIFLATPHRGSQYAKTLNNILSAAPIQAPPKSYISALERQSAVIQDINEVFGHQCDDLSLVSFYETLPVKIGFTKLVIVEKDLAVLGYRNELSASMNADHNTISKCESEMDPNYIRLKNTLKRLLIKGKGNVTERVRTFSSPFVYETAADRSPSTALGQQKKQRHNRARGTWLSGEKGFASWLQATRSATDPRFYWLFGLPGSGKTVLSNIIIDQLQGRNQAPQFHFFSEAHQGKRAIAYPTQISFIKGARGG